MFSYFKPHRRTPSNPSSPVPEQTHSWNAPLHHPNDHGHPRAYDVHSPQTSLSAVSASPVFLPPIARVASPPLESQFRSQDDAPAAEESGWRYQQRSPDAPAQDFHNVAYQHSTFQTTSPRPDSAGNLSASFRTGTQISRPPAEQALEEKRGGGTFSHGSAAGPVSTSQTTGRRPAGARMPTPPPQPAPNLISTFEPAQQRSGKARLNLLNPMSLLARRRTSQAVPQLAPVPVPRNPVAPKSQEIFDPRIRGTKVHDFNAPRPRRNVSYGDVRYSAGDDQSGITHQRSPSAQVIGYGFNHAEERETSPWSGGNHTPVFTEDFEEEQYPAAGPHVRKASDLSNLTAPKPAFAKGLHPISNSSSAQVQDPPTSLEKDTSIPSQPPDYPPPVPPKSDDRTLLKPSPQKRISIDTQATPPRGSSSSFKSRSRNVSDVSAKEFSLHGLPKHMRSTSSRFSFDMIGAAEQEKILEDRHRQKALEKSNTSPVLEDERVDFDEDDFDYDNMDDDDGFEERIPGINADAEEDEFHTSEHLDIRPATAHGMAAFTFHPMGISVEKSPMSPMSPYSPGMVATPRDANGDVIGFAQGSPGLTLNETDNTADVPPLDPDKRQSLQDIITGGLGLQGVDLDHSEHEPGHAVPLAQRNEIPTVHDDEDDLYFDDGLIDDVDNVDDGAEFDESVFDNDDTDEYGRPLRPLSSLPTLYSPPYVRTDFAPGDPSKHEIDEGNRISQVEKTLQALPAPAKPPAELPEEQKADTPNAHELKPRPSMSLTHDTLSAYQYALAAAAHNAAANGRFRRDSSLSPRDDQADDARLGEDEESEGRFPDSGHDFVDNEEVDDFDYDDVLDDDAIIAEANAEALANDSDGFYGQEFGFYSAPAATEAFYANGGYFGPRGFDDLVRSKSGRVGGREPNLTPITERSEYSNRNSLMSLGGPAYASSVAGSNPGLAQLAGMMSELDEDNMSLSALMKLRRGAWGGSQASSIGNGSPIMSHTAEEFSPGSSQPLWSPSSALGQAKRYSAFSIGMGSEFSSAPASPTLTLETMAKAADAAAMPPPPPTAMLHSLNQRPLSPTLQKASVVGMVDSTETDNASGRQGRSHRHTGSADSISYMKEGDPVAGERWVLERRRTAESGEVEILGREIVSGGRI